ncbi:hypothetical protein JCM15519_30430 [Fundidesulfovibrio butyratiphilus]
MMLKSPHHDLQCPPDGALQACAGACAVTGIVHQLAESLGRAIDAKDRHTLAHSEEVAVIAQTLDATCPARSLVSRCDAALYRVKASGGDGEALAEALSVAPQGSGK